MINNAEVEKEILKACEKCFRTGKISMGYNDLMDYMPEEYSWELSEQNAIYILKEFLHGEIVLHTMKRESGHEKITSISPIPSRVSIYPNNNKKAKMPPRTNQPAQLGRCPSCKRGVLNRRRSTVSESYFYICSNSKCDYTIDGDITKDLPL